MIKAVIRWGLILTGLYVLAYVLFYALGMTLG